MDGIKERYGALRKVLDERARRLVVAAESLAWGRGGLSVVSRATGVSRRAIRQGRAELKQPSVRRVGRIRRPGGGRKRLADVGAVQKMRSLIAHIIQLHRGVVGKLPLNRQ